MSLIEVLLSLGMLATALLALLSVCVTALHTNRKSLANSAATSLAQRELDRAIYAALSDNPPTSQQQFWDMEFPYPDAAWSTGNATVGSQQLSYAIYAQTVTAAATGMPLGQAGSPPARLKKVDIVVWWWSEGAKGHAREGYGRLECCASRLVSENEAR